MNHLRERGEPALAEDDHRPEGTQRYLLARKPTRELTVMRVVGDEWEFIDARGNRFARVLNERQDKWFRYPKCAKARPERTARRARSPKYVRFCCAELRRAWGRFIDIGRLGPSIKRMPRITIFDKEARSTIAIHFCPFCGKELQLAD